MMINNVFVRDELLFCYLIIYEGLKLYCGNFLFLLHHNNNDAIVIEKISLIYLDNKLAIVTSIFLTINILLLLLFFKLSESLLFHSSSKDM